MNLIDYNFKLNAIIKDGYLTTNEIALMFVIINLQNTLRTEMFGLPTRTTSAHLNLSMPTYYRTLEGLESKGLVQIVEPGKKNQAPIIRIIFDKKFLANTCTIEESFSHSIKENEQMLLKNFSESVHINKKEERIRKKEYTTNNNKSKIEPFGTPEKSIEQLWDSFMDQVNSRMHIFHSNFQLSEEKVLERCENFKNFGLLKGNTYTNQYKMFDHFIHWNNKQVERPKKKHDANSMTADEIAEFVASKIIK